MEKDQLIQPERGRIKESHKIQRCQDEKRVFRGLVVRWYQKWWGDKRLVAWAQVSWVQPKARWFGLIIIKVSPCLYTKLPTAPCIKVLSRHVGLRLLLLLFLSVVQPNSSKGVHWCARGCARGWQVNTVVIDANKWCLFFHLLSLQMQKYCHSVSTVCPDEAQITFAVSRCESIKRWFGKVSELHENTRSKMNSDMSVINSMD